MKIVFTRHAENKIKDLGNLGIIIKKSALENVLRYPIHLETESDYPNKIASGKFGKNRILRVVYRKESDIIIVITFYPAKKDRYF